MESKVKFGKLDSAKVIKHRYDSSFSDKNYYRENNAI